MVTAQTAVKSAMKIQQEAAKVTVDLKVQQETEAQQEQMVPQAPQEPQEQTDAQYLRQVTQPT